MLRVLTSVLHRALRPSRGDRRGTVLLLALGVLGILSIAAISYVTIIRLDRASAEAGSRRASYQQQPDAVVEHIGALLTADLFGEKIVTDEVPAEFWPRMFEDGDTRDLPFTDLVRNSFDTADPDAAQPSANAILLAPSNNLTTTELQQRRVAYPDDAWLASYDPLWNPATGNPQSTRRWPQITNLRSSYLWKGKEGALGKWVRDNGRFVDLGQWFIQASYLSPMQGFPNPGVQLMKWTGADGVTIDGQLGPDKGVDQDVFQYQVNLMARYTAPTDSTAAPNGSVDPLTPRDERQWVDTDGDLRPDARWQQLDVLGNLFGLNWVVAARIVDASALVNVNTALEFGAEQDTDGTRQADGRTPADVDLYRLIVGAGNPPASNAFARRVRNNAINNAFSEWINTDLDMQGILADAKTIYDAGGGAYFAELQNTRPWTLNERTRRIDREAFYHFFASSPQKTATPRGTTIPIRDLIDLASFSGSNNDNMVSRTEQRFDGPSVNGFLPDGSSTGDFGPMRSRERPEDIRRFATAPETAAAQRPTSQQLKESRRRLLTTISGDAPFMPIPVLNTGPNSAFKGRVAADPRLPLDAPLSDDGVRRAFEAFVWALAPMATDLPLNRGMKEANLFNRGGADFHYGGGMDGPAELFREWQRFYPVPTTAANPPISTTEADASFATVTAASLAANLKDALDIDGNPSILRVFAQAFASPGAQPLTAGTRHPTTLTKPVVLTSEFMHGAIDPQNLKTIGAPTPGPTTSDPTKGGITVVGLERQPFLSEVTTIAIYSDSPLDRVVGADFLGGNGDHIVGNSTDEELGSAILIELLNPWSTPIRLDGYSIVIPESADQIGANPFTVSLPNTITIAPGASARFYWALEWEFGVWADVRDAIVGRPIFANGLALTDDAISPTPSLSGLRIPFRDLLGNQSRPVLLVFDRRTIDLPPHPGYIVDRMAPDLHSPPDINDAFPRGIDGGFDLGFDATPPTNVPTGLTFDDYYGPGKLGYVEFGAGPPPFNNRNRVLNREVTGRVMVTSSLSRSGVNARSTAPTSSGGFPLTILEVPNANHTVHRVDAHAWIYPFVPTAANPEPTTSKAIPADIINGDLVGPYNFPGDHSSIGAATKFADDVANQGRIDPAKVSAFQLYVPLSGTGPTGARLNALSELHMLSSYANTCRTRDAQTPRDWEIELADLQNWQTVGEKMGLSLLRDFDSVQAWDPAPAVSVYPTGPLNPYVGVLDPSRFIPGSPNMVPFDSTFPDTMRIPLALRVFDCFWPASLNTTLAQGRININTAPEQVLECLPLVSPPFQLGAGGNPLPVGRDRLDAMTLYRDPVRQLDVKGTIGLTGLREQVGDAPLPRGFSSTGELAILDSWEGGDTGQIVSGALRWMQLANPADLTPSDGAPLEMVTDYADPTYNPVDDPEERLALYRAVSNIVTTRSDVFLAWFVIRGYEPAVIERIPINGSSVQERLRAMDDETLRPAYESRWLVVFDRSNVRRPTDRPNVLLQVELPRSTP